MSIPKKVLNYLANKDVSYEVVEHRTVYTAYDLAMTLKMKENQIAKNLLIKADKDFVIVVLSANKNIDLKKFAKVAGAAKADMPKEGIMKTKFKVHPGALPAFGGVNKLSVYVDKALSKESRVLFSVGSFTESIRMTVKNFIKLEQAEIGVFSVAKKIKKSKVNKPVKKKLPAQNKPKKRATTKKVVKKRIKK